jgi:hypothetical protein
MSETINRKEKLEEDVYALLKKLDMLQTRVLSVAWHMIPHLQSEFPMLPRGKVKREDEERFLEDFYQAYSKGSFDAYLKKREERWAFYRSPEWAEKKAEAYAVFGHRCMACGASGGPLSVDHIISRNEAPEKELEIRNLQILCVLCNKGKSGSRQDFRKREDLLNLIRHLGIRL